ncbi:MAG: hypothetical protein K2X39_08025 [Silvanigrellaceae bacterium]|nr:hypothetical protein [Silvanigrellaceae bacterium]
MAEQFLELYPKHQWIDKSRGRWEHFPTPIGLSAISPDGFFQQKKYSRIVDTIDFDSLSSFRLAAANTNPGSKDTTETNFWLSKTLLRTEFPFYIFYEWTKSAVGGTFCFQGPAIIAFNEKENKILPQAAYTHQPNCKIITEYDEETKQWLGVFPKKGAFHVWYEPTPLGAFNKITKEVLNWCLASTILYFCLQGYSLVCLLTLFLSLSIYPLEIFYPKVLEKFGQPYHIYSGGDDPLTYEGLGIAIAHDLKQGNILEALKGGESVYYYQPGFRYFKAFFRFLFGSHSFEFILCFYLLIVSLYFLFRNIFEINNKYHIIGIVISLSLILFTNHLSFFETIRLYAHIGKSESLACPLFIFGVIILLNQIKQKQLIQYNTTHLFIASFLGSSSVFIRPNFLFGYLICLAIIFFDLFKKKEFKYIIPIILGSINIFLPLMHNLYYSNKAFLFSSTSIIDENLIIHPKKYLSIINLNFNSPDLLNIKCHFSNWINGSFINIISIISVLISAKNWEFIDNKILKNLSFITIGLYLPSLFYQNSHRFVYMSFIFSYIVLAYIICKIIEKFLGYYFSVFIERSFSASRK